MEVKKWREKSGKVCGCGLKKKITSIIPLLVNVVSSCEHTVLKRDVENTTLVRSNNREPYYDYESRSGCSIPRH